MLRHCCEVGRPESSLEDHTDSQMQIKAIRMCNYRAMILPGASTRPVQLCWGSS